MRAIHWAQFSWDLTKSVPGRPVLPPSFSIRRATYDDEEAVHTVVMSAFTLDSEWNSFFGEVRPLLEGALERIFGEKGEPPCLVVSHGPRVIGVSGLSAERDACNHLLTGPCLSLEYHNRGFATVLLAHSLSFLHEAGLSAARGATKEGSIAAQFIYTKFGAMRLPAADSLAEDLDQETAEARKAVR